MPFSSLTAVDEDCVGQLAVLELEQVPVSADGVDRVQGEAVNSLGPLAASVGDNNLGQAQAARVRDRQARAEVVWDENR